MIPLSAFAIEENMKILVSSQTGVKGSIVNVDISIEDNPGITSMTINVVYGNGIELEEVVYNSAFVEMGIALQPQSMLSPVRLNWVNGTTNCNTNGVFATLKFKVLDTAVTGSKIDVGVEFSPDNIINTSEQNISTSVKNGEITVVDVMPGDINGDGKTNGKDQTRLIQYFAGWDVYVNQQTLDVNGDGKINGKDQTRLIQYFAGWDVEIFAGDLSATNCSHSMIPTEAKAATCVSTGNIAYWTCSLCGKYFSDALGVTQINLTDTVTATDEHNHANLVGIPAVAPTETQSGNTEGSECKACNSVVIEPTVIPALGESNYHIVYDLDNNVSGQDEYIANWLLNNKLDNPNPTTAPKDKELTLIRFGVDGYPEIPGYSFVGWFDAVGNPVSAIPAGSEGTIHVQAKWKLNVYTVTLYKNKNKKDSEKITDTYTVDKGYTLNPIEWNHYLFVAWTDSDGNVASKIESGTIGDKEFVANWTSERNQTVPEKNISEPLLIYEDEAAARFYFTYKIGKIINVPLYTIKDFENTMGSGISVKYTDSTTGVVTKEQADSISNMISNATTKSGSWTLSEEWNEKTSISENHTSEVTQETISSASSNFSSSGSRNISSYSEGKDESVLGTETYAKVEASVTAGVGVGPYKVEAGLSAGTGETVTTGDSSMRYWNTNNSYSSNYSSNSSSSFTNALKESIVNQIGSSQEKGHNVLNSTTTEVGESSTEAREYMSQLTISTGETEASAIEFSSNDSTPAGWYRYVAAGTVHVYAVVGYDVATSTYFTYTYSVLDDDIHGFIDYSTVSSYDDYENGVLPFEVPLFVNDYLDDKLAETEGVKVNADGQVFAYTGSSNVKTVAIPDYHVIDNYDGTYSFVKVTEILPNVFKGNTNIETVKIGRYVTEIPEGTFEGCIGLKQIIAPSITSIGAKAFKGCRSLEKYTVSESVTSLGVNAFNGVKEIEVHASSKSVAEAAASSGAENILLDISPVLKQTNTAERDNIAIKVGEIEKFELRGFRNEYVGLTVASDAETTVINGITIPYCANSIPLKLSSSELVLTNVNVKSFGVTMLLKNENTDVTLNGKIQMESDSGDTVVTQNTVLLAPNYGELAITGKMLVYGTVVNSTLVTGGTVETISDDRYTELCNFISDWVLADTLPEGIAVSAEKWTYDLVTNITSDEASVDGYTLYDTTSEWGEYGEWSDWSDTSVSGDDYRQVETQQVQTSSAYTQYNLYYYRYWNSSANCYYYTYSSSMGGTLYKKSVKSTDVYHAGTYDGYKAYKKNSGYYNYSAELWFVESTAKVSAKYKTQYRYRDRELIYTYHHTKSEAMESGTEITASETVTNVQKWVKYVIE